MKIEDFNKLYEEIEQKKYHNEDAHILEDTLRDKAFEEILIISDIMITEMDDVSIEARDEFNLIYTIAKLALSTEDIEFERWYA